MLEKLLSNDLPDCDVDSVLFSVSLDQMIECYIDTSNGMTQPQFVWTIRSNLIYYIVHGPSHLLGWLNNSIHFSNPFILCWAFGPLLYPKLAYLICSFYLVKWPVSHLSPCRELKAASSSLLLYPLSICSPLLP